MKHFYWLTEGAIGGRTGPNTHHWDPAEFRANGFSAILSVNGGDAVDPERITEAGLAYANIPMSANAPVQTGDLEFCLDQIPRAMDFISTQIQKGPVLVHCRSGKDRTGMVLAAYLIRFENYTATEAMRKVLEVRPIAFTAEGWMDFGFEVLSGFEDQWRRQSDCPGS